LPRSSLSPLSPYSTLFRSPMPVNLQINYVDGQSKTISLPVEIWMTGPEYVYHAADSDAKIASVVIDPKHLVPDANPANNTLNKLDRKSTRLNSSHVSISYA